MAPLTWLLTIVLPKTVNHHTSGPRVYEQASNALPKDTGTRTPTQTF